LFDAPSISITSMFVPAAIDLQLSQLLQGSGVGPSERWQFKHLHRIRAEVVFPMPRDPMNRNAWPMRPARIAFLSVRVTCSWPMTSSKVCGRQRRASTR